MIIVILKKRIYIKLKFRVSRTNEASPSAIGEIDIVAEFFVRKIADTSEISTPRD